MADLYNTKTRERVKYEDHAGDLEEKIHSGELSYRTSGRINVLDESGDVYNVPAKGIKDALELGYRIETPMQASIREYTEQNKGLRGDIKAGLSQFADEAAFGIPEMIYDATTDPLDRARKDALKQQHILANNLGGTAGFAASLLGGPVGLWARVGSKAGQGTARLASRMLGTSATAQMASKGVIKNLLEKVPATALEGVVDMAPIALTEAALGDEELAAESLMLAGGFGSALGAVTGVGGTLFKKLNTDVATDIGTKSTRVKEGAKKMARILTGVKEADMEYLIQNIDRLQNPNVVPEFDELIERVGTKMEAIQAAKKIDDDVAANMGIELMDKISAEGKYLSDLSTMSYSALSDADGFISTGPLKRKLKELEDKLKIEVYGKQLVPGGKAHRAGLDAIASQKAFLAQVDKLEGVPKNQLPLGSVKSLVGTLDDDINYAAAKSGGMTRAEDLALNEYRGYINSLLRDKGGMRFKDIMDELAERTSSLVNFKQNFRDEYIAKSFFLDPSNYKKSELLRKFSKNTGDNYDEFLDERKAARDLADEFKGYTWKSSDRLVKGKLRSRDEKIIRRLDELHDTTLERDIKDAKIIEVFRAQERARGSARTVLGSVVGAWLGGPPGAAIGAAAGRTMDVTGGMGLKSIIEAGIQAKRGVLFTEGKLKNFAKKLDTIPNLLKGVNKKAPTFGAASKMGLYRILGGYLSDKDVKNSTRRQRHKLYTEKLTEAISRPQLLQERLFKETSGLAESGAPAIAQALTVKSLEAMSYLYDQLPKQQAPQNPWEKPIPYVPNNVEMAVFEDKAAIVENPMLIFELLEEGILNKNHVDALKEVYPVVYEEVRQKVFTSAVELSQKGEYLAYDQRLKLSILLDIPLDPSLKRIASYQEAFAELEGEEQAEDTGAKTKAKSVRLSRTQKNKMTASTFTASQRSSENLLKG